MAAKFEINQDARGESRPRLETRRGAVIASGKSHRMSTGAGSGPAAVERAAATATIVEG